MSMKDSMKLLSVWLSLWLVIGLAVQLPQTAVSAAAELSTNAQAAALIDAASGRILYSHNGDEPLRIASLTKIMTAIVAIENGQLSDKVKVGVNAYGVEGSSIYLRLGEEMSLKHLLYGLMLRSGNDAATAIAEHVGGTVDGFVMMMNEKAEQLGLANTHFENPHGLDAEGHLSSANDLAKLTAYCLHNPVFRDIVKTPSIKVPNAYEKWDHLWRNKNKMLHLFEGADGVKTGYTKTARRTLVSSATRGGQQLAAVTLNDGNDWADHARMLEYGFKQYPLREIYKAGTAYPNTELVSSASIHYALSEEEYGQIAYEIVQEPADQLPYRLGVRAYGIVKINREELVRLPLYERKHPMARTLYTDWMDKIKQVAFALFAV